MPETPAAARSSAARLYQIVKQRLRPAFVRVEVPAYFENRADILLFTARGRDSIAIQFSQQGWGGFEPPVPDVVAACAQRCDGAFLDVGANTGIYALIVARASPETEIHAFEPYPPARAILQRNLERNGVTSRVRIVDLALSDSTGQQPMYVPLQDHGLLESSCSLSAEFKGEHSAVLEVGVTTLDAYSRRAGLERVGLIKIDVESTEDRVLGGGAEVLAGDRPLIVLEVLHLANATRLGAFCREQGYVPFLIHPEGIRRRREVAFHGEAWNQCFCPEERTDVLRDSADRVGLRFTG